ncbi:MAG: efflux RND transporter periplasmic adaptor subunit [Thermodesulfovibrionales bacterium]|nr:efflux RND transporter periplasmic adaptor subunit [Thermodesulfovibrionales bacterium]
MIRKYLLPVIAVIGAVFAVYSVFSSSKPAPVPPPVVQPAQAPFKSYIAGAGITEASTENIAVSTNLSGVIKKVFVTVGARVKQGYPLFTLDDRELLAERSVRLSALQNAKERLSKLVSLPRPEDIPPAEARVKEAETSLSEMKHHLQLAECVTDRRAISVEELARRRYAVQTAEAKLAEVNAQLALLKAGAWKPDVEIAKADISNTEAQVKAIETAIERLTVLAPINGEILQINLRSGEYAQTGVLQKPLMLIGNLDRLHVRVDVDENDAWRFRKDASAIAFVRGNREMKTPIKYERTEPYVIPKKSLTGDSTERVDTRVMQVVYSFERSQLPVYVGQLMDVFIEAPSVTVISAGARQTHEKNDSKNSNKEGRSKK